MARLVSTHEPMYMRIALMTGSVLGFLCVAIALIRYPASAEQDALYIIALALIALCAVAAWQMGRLNTPEDAAVLRLSWLFGLGIGAAWMTEVLAGNIGNTGSTAQHLIYRAATLFAFSLPFVAGIGGALRTGTIRAGAAVGFWSGLLSGLVTLLTLMIVTYTFMDVFQHDPQMIREYTHSREANLATYIVGDLLVAGCSHLLLIGVLWGTALGTLGAGLGARIARRDGKRAAA